MNKIRVYMGLPSNGTVVDSQAYVLRDIAAKYADKIELVYPKQLVQRIFHDAARNGIVEEFLESGCDVLWFLDSDITPPRHTLDLITEHWDKWECAGAPYPIFMGGKPDSSRIVQFTVYDEAKDGKLKLSPSCPQSGTAFVGGLATGCLFIKRSVFEKIERPFFEFKYDPITRAPTEGEDIGFCLKMQKLGIKFFTDYSMVCKHQKTLDLLELNNYCIEHANALVLAYDEQIKLKVEAAIKAAYKAGLAAGKNAAQRPSGLILPK